MYEAFYKLTTKPFRLSPDPQFFYPSAGHKRALSYLLYGLNQAEGFVVITGSPGTGKTTLAHKLLSQIDAQSVMVAHLASTQIEAEDLLRLVAASFKLRSEHVSKAALLKDIESFLLARARERKRCLLVVDEAQNLPARSIEELRMLSNFQVGNKALMQVFLLGQEQFRTMLDSSEFEQLRQRVIADYHLHALDAEETRRYIEARLQHAGWQNDPQFDAGAYTQIFQYTGGLPRRINMFCDRLLLFGYLEGLHALTQTTVSAVIAELHNEILPRNGNVVFTPADRAADPVAATEPHAPMPAAVRISSPPADNPAPPAIPTLAARAVTDRAAASQSVTAAPAMPPSTAKPVDAVPAKTGRLHAARSAPAAPMHDISDASIADFLLTPSPRTPSTAANIDGLDLNTLNEQPHRLSRSAPSLAGTESRWLLMLSAGCVVLALLAFWLYPSMRDSLRRMQPAETGSQAVLSGPVEHSTELAQQITDPSENILTENRILAAPPVTPDNAPAVGSTEESLHESTEAAVITPAQEKTDSVENKPATITVTSSKPVSRSAGHTAKSIKPESKIPLKTKSDAGTVTRQDPVSTPPASEAKLVTAEPLDKAGPSATMVSELPAIAQTDTRAQINPISQRELALLLMKFTRYYEEGNLPMFLSLFDEQVRTEDSNSIEAIRNDYSDLFRKSNLRQILFGDLHWENAGRLAQGSGPFEVRISTMEGEPARSLKGDITFHLEKKDGRIVIIALYHTPH